MFTNKDDWFYWKAFEEVQLKTNAPDMTSFFSVFKPEILEILNQLDEGIDDGLAFYRINKGESFSSKLKRVIWNLLINLKKALQNKEDSGNHTRKDILVIIESENHYRHFKSIKKQLSENGKSCAVLFLGRAQLQKYASECDYPLFIGDSDINSGLNQYLKFILINAKIISNTGFGMLSPKPPSYFKMELLLLNSRYLWQKLSIESTLIDLLNKIRPSLVICFKSEGFKVRSILRI